MAALLDEQTQINHALSNRFIALDPGGYFIIYVDPVAQLICAQHFTNNIDEQGLAIDPETGKPFACNVKLERQPTAVFKAKTAKEVCIQLFESDAPSLVTKFDHAAYLGRELMKAEIALATGQVYVQD